MSILFTPSKLGQLQIKNRFVFSACEDNLATEEGFITDDIIKKMTKLSVGEVGLLISNHMAVHPLGRTRKKQLGIFDNSMVSGLTKLVDNIHENDSKIIFQLGYSGEQQNPTYLDQLDEYVILEIIQSFTDAAKRAVDSGADGIQLHAAHGYLINQFLSPFFNHRKDSWGNSEIQRFRFLKEIIISIKTVIPNGMPLLVKLNSNDYTPSEGIVPSLANIYIKFLKELQIGGIEISCGTALSTWNMCRGEVPIQEILRLFDEPQKPKVEVALKNMKDKFKFTEPYNLDFSKSVKSTIDNITILTVGGWRDVSTMEDAILNGYTDFISLCRPLIIEPFFVKSIKEGKTSSSSCKNCNKCLAAVGNNIPVKCYVNGFPN